MPIRLGNVARVIYCEAQFSTSISSQTLSFMLLTKGAVVESTLVTAGLGWVSPKLRNNIQHVVSRPNGSLALAKANTDVVSSLKKGAKLVCPHWMSRVM